MKQDPIQIIRAGIRDASLLSRLGSETFLASHGHSASPASISDYINATYTKEKMEEELSLPDNIYHLLYYQTEAAGFTKICFDSPYGADMPTSTAKLDRIYLLERFQGLKLGKTLLDFNIRLCRDQGQTGIWLYVWIENHRAVAFYTKAGFRIIGSFDFRITDTHTNPNHRMLLEW